MMTHFRTISQQIAQYRVIPPAGQAQARGFVLLNQCHVEAQAVLALVFDAGPAPGNFNAEEQTKKQLQRYGDAFREAEHDSMKYIRILLDAACRRFRVQKIYLRTVACMRWVQRRTQVLQGQVPNASNAAALAQLDNTLNSVGCGALSARQHLLNL